MRNPKLKPFRSYIQSWTAREPTLDREEVPGIMSLPYEIIVAIIESLAEREKARIIQTCRYFRNLVEPILYRHIRVWLDPDTFRQATLRAYLLHKTLMGRQDLLPGILSYSGPVSPNVSELQQAFNDAKTTKTLWLRLRNAGSWPRTPPTHDKCFQAAKTIFSGMVNIQDLKFTDAVGQWTPELWDTFAATKSNRKIERLALWIHGDYPFLMPILRAQPRLKHLDMGRSGGTQVEGLQSTDLQELRSLRTNLSEAAILVPGRPIERLELLHYEVRLDFLNHQPNPVEARFKNLGLSTCDITDFTMRFQTSWDDDVSEKTLRFVVGYLPRIERLCLVVHGVLSEDILLETIPTFDSLRHLILLGDVSKKEKFSTFAGRDYYASIVCGPQDFVDFAQRLKARCPRLIDIEQKKNPWK